MRLTVEATSNETGRLLTHLDRLMHMVPRFLTLTVMRR
jgi:hypothetical protein